MQARTAKLARQDASKYICKQAGKWIQACE